MTRARLVPALVLVAAVAALAGSGGWAVGRGRMTWWGGRHATMMGVSSGGGRVTSIADARARFTRVASGCASRMMGAAVGAQDAVPAVALTSSEAIARAKAWLDANQRGSRAAGEAAAFPGYATIDVTKDGKVSGMLSVNATTGQVWYHWWHGAFVGMSE